MRIMKLLGLAFLATLAFSAVGTLGAGSAAALLFLTESGKELLFTIKSLGNATFESASGSRFECKSVLGHGFIMHKTDSVRKILLTFHECGSGLTQCTSSGEPSGLIKTLELDALLVTLLSPLDKYGLKLLAESGNLAEYTCGLGSVELRGSVVGEYEETLAESETFKKEVKLVFEKGVNSGEPRIRDYETLNGAGTAKLESKSGGGAFEEMNLQMLLDLISDGNVKFCHK